MKESQIQREIVTLLRELGFAVWDTSQGYRKERGGTRMTAGLPDLVVIGHGMCLFVEVKRPKGKLTAAQELFRDECYRNGVLWQKWTDVRECWDWLVMHEIIEEGVAL